MVDRLLHFLHREIRGLHEAAYLLGLFALFSQLLALVRDRLLASAFGAGEILDVYYAAFRIPDLVFVGIASIISVYVLVPFFSDKIAQSKEAARAFISEMFSLFLLSMLAVSAALFFFVPHLLPLLFPGLVGSPLFDELVVLSRLLLLQPILLGLSGLFGSVTQYYRKFLLYAVSPLLYNIGIIFGIVFLYPQFGISGLGFGVLLGALLHAAIQIPFLHRGGFLPLPVFRIDWREARRVIAVSLPRTVTLSANQISLLVFAGIASVIGAGSITVFNFAFNLQSVPLAIIGVSYSVAAFPILAKFFSNGERHLFADHILTAARHIIFWSLPAMVLFIVLRAQIVRVILGAGEFGWTDTRLTAAALALFMVSLTAHGLMLLFVRGYYAAGKTRTPLLINIGTSVLSVSFAFLFLFLFSRAPLFQYFIESLFRVEGLSGTAVLMLPLGYSLAFLFNAIAFMIVLPRDLGVSVRELARVGFQSLSGAVVAGFAAHRALNVLDGVFDINTFFGIFFQGLLAGALGVVAGVITLYALKSGELREAWQSLHRRFWKTPTISSGQSEL